MGMHIERVSGRARGTARRVLLACLATIVVIAGLLPAPEAVGLTTASLNGTGPGSSQIVALDAGIYRLKLDYSGNTDKYGATNFIAHLESVSDNTWESLANDIDSAGSITQLLRLRAAESVWLDIDAAQSASWTASFSRVAAADAATVPYSASFTGRDTTGPVRLGAGLYSVKVVYSDNADNYGATNFIMGLESEDSWQDTIFNDIATSGSITKNVRASSSGIYWLNVTDAAAGAHWSVTMKSLDNQFSSVARPTIKGTLRVSELLSVSVPAWSPAATSYSYQWLRSGTSISGATGSTYRLGAADVGVGMSVSVTGGRSGYMAVTTTSVVTGKVAAGKLSATPKPKISGKVKVGRTLKAKPGTWKPSGVALKYQWYRGSARISGATAASYKLTTADRGKKIKVSVTGVKTGYGSVTKTSSTTAKVKK